MISINPTASRMSFSHPLTQLVTLSHTLPTDSLTYEQKQVRDRNIAINAGANTPAEQVQAWLADRATETTRRYAEHWLFSWHLVQLILFILGLVTGVGLSSLVLQYDGSQPINIIAAWLVLVGLPFTLMCLWLLTLLPFKFPLVSLLSEVLQRALFQPVSQWLLHRLNKPQMTSHQNALGFTPSRRLLFAMSNVLMQWFALGVGLGALGGALYLLASSDLAFAWSTSFGIEATRLHTITTKLAAPFAAFFEIAVPSLELVENSQYFRLEEAADRQFTQNNAANQLTQWWPFLIASIGFYTVLPRIFTLLIAYYQLKRSLYSELRALPDYAGLIARMNAPLVTTTGQNIESNKRIDTPEPAPEAVRFSLVAPLVNWGAIEITPEQLEPGLENIGLSAQGHFSAGGRNSRQQDREVINQLQAARAESVLILVKAWEPPLLEFRDWLVQLRGVISGSIIVLLVDPDNRQPQEADLSMWRADLQQLADQALYVQGLPL